MIKNKFNPSTTLTINPERSRRIKIVRLPLVIIFLFVIIPLLYAQESKKWIGVDESVIEKIAAEHGRVAWTPFINTDQGELLLFVFLLAGVIGGFVLGYNFRRLFTEKAGLTDVK